MPEKEVEAARKRLANGTTVLLAAQDEVAEAKLAVEKAGNGAASNPIIDSSTHLAEVLADVPVLAIPCALGSPEDAGDKGGSQAGWWGSVIPSVWSYCLAARSRGLGTVWTTLHLPYASASPPAPASGSILKSSASSYRVIVIISSPTESIRAGRRWGRRVGAASRGWRSCVRCACSWQPPRPARSAT